MPTEAKNEKKRVEDDQDRGVVGHSGEGNCDDDRLKLKGASNSFGDVPPFGHEGKGGRWGVIGTIKLQ
jgi:hypothetical protein